MPRGARQKLQSPPPGRAEPSQRPLRVERRPTVACLAPTRRARATQTAEPRQGKGHRRARRRVRLTGCCLRAAARAAANSAASDELDDESPGAPAPVIGGSGSAITRTACGCLPGKGVSLLPCADGAASSAELAVPGVPELAEIRGTARRPAGQGRYASTAICCGVSERSRTTAGVQRGSHQRNM